MTDRKPEATVEQVAWVLRCLLENARERGTFRSLIYGVMGFGLDSHRPLVEAGGVEVNNRMGDDSEPLPPPHSS